jgi:hypothetical protein
MINLLTDFDGISPYPIFFILVPLAVELLLADGAGEVSERACWRWDRGVGLGG